MTELNPASPSPADLPAAAAPGTLKWWQKDWFFTVAVIIVTALIAYGMARYELVNRAKKAYLEGEKYYSWMNEPAKKKAFFDGELAAKRVTQDQYDLMMQDSDLKNAYVWYDTVVELFQPPKSEWVLKSEDRLKEIKPKYDAWLKSLGVDPVD